MPKQENEIRTVNGIVALLTGVLVGYGENSKGISSSIIFWTVLVNESKTHCLFREAEQAEAYVLEFSEIADELKNAEVIRVIPLSINPRSLFEMVDQLRDE